jgi:hypothetical protein
VTRKSGAAADTDPTSLQTWIHLGASVQQLAAPIHHVVLFFLRSLQDQMAVLAASLANPNIEKGPAYATRNSTRVMLGCHSLPVGE